MRVSLRDGFVGLDAAVTRKDPAAAREEEEEATIELITSPARRYWTRVPRFALTGAAVAQDQPGAALIAARNRGQPARPGRPPPSVHGSDVSGCAVQIGDELPCAVGAVG